MTGPRIFALQRRGARGAAQLESKRPLPDGQACGSGFTKGACPTGSRWHAGLEDGNGLIGRARNGGTELVFENDKVAVWNFELAPGEAAYP